MGPKTDEMAAEIETFEQVVTRYRQFLAENGYSMEIIWVRPQDVLATRTRGVYIRVPVPVENEEMAKEMYYAVINADCGLRMATLASDDGKTYCYLWGRLEDHQKEPQLWPNRGLAMSALSGESRRVAHTVRSATRWVCLKWRLRTKQAQKGLMFM